jgi:hypothetical protein
MFDKILESYTLNTDAIRDFVNTVGATVEDERTKENKAFSEVFVPILTANAIVEQNVDKLKFPEDFKNSLKGLIETTRLKIADGSLNLSKLASLLQEIHIPVMLKDGALALDDAAIPPTRLLRSHRRWLKAADKVRILYESSLMTLISAAEWTLAQLLHEFFARYPGAIGSDQPFFSLERLTLLGSVEDARKALIDHRVDELMRGSFENWIQFLKKYIKLHLEYLVPIQDQVSEAFKRRNVLVHNGGEVNNYYIGSVPKQLREGVSIGDRITVDSTYIQVVVNSLELAFALMTAELWKKLEPANEKRSDILLGLSIDHLNAARWETARAYSQFVMLDTVLSESCRLRGLINYWQSFKWAGQYYEIKDEVEGYDFSAKDCVYRLAHAAISNRYDLCAELLPVAIGNGSLSRFQFNDWPLFQGLRKRPDFAAFLDTKTDEMAPVAAETDPPAQVH